MDVLDSRKSRLIPWKSWFAVEDADLPELKDSLFRVWVVLNMLFARKRYGPFFVSDRRLAEICAVHPHTIKRRVIKLVEHKLIEAKRSQGRIPNYRILPLDEFRKYQNYRKQFKQPRKKNTHTLRRRVTLGTSLHEVVQ